MLRLHRHSSRFPDQVRDRLIRGDLFGLHLLWRGARHGNMPQRAMALIPDVGNANRHDQQMAQRSRAAVCQRAVGSHSLPGYGPVIFVNRPVRTRMPGGVGAGGEKPPATRLGLFSVRIGVESRPANRALCLFKGLGGSRAILAL